MVADQRAQAPPVVGEEDAVGRRLGEVEVEGAAGVPGQGAGTEGEAHASDGGKSRSRARSARQAVVVPAAAIAALMRPPTMKIVKPSWIAVDQDMSVANFSHGTPIPKMASWATTKPSAAAAGRRSRPRSASVPMIQAARTKPSR